jgi:F-type H+-transporting ATPase subunit c
MNLKRLLALTLAAFLFLPAAVASAQDEPVAVDEVAVVETGSNLGEGLGVLGLGLGLGLLVYGAAMGIGNIGGRAAESIARQPEAGGRIFTTMIVSAALIEGATLFAILAFILK